MRVETRRGQVHPRQGMRRHETSTSLVKYPVVIVTPTKTREYYHAETWSVVECTNAAVTSEVEIAGVVAHVYGYA